MELVTASIRMLRPSVSPVQPISLIIAGMKKWFKVTLYGLGSLVVLSLIGRINPTDDHTQTTLVKEQQQAAMKQAARTNAQRDLVIKTFRWQKNEGGSVGYHWFTIYNASRRHTYARIPVQFIYYSETGDEVGRIDKVIDKAIKMGKTVHLDQLETELPDQHAEGADLKIID